jgi:hypothetical protein
MDKSSTLSGKMLTFQPPNYHTWQAQFMTQCQSQFSLLACALPTGDFPDYVMEFRKTRDFSRLPSRVQYPFGSKSKSSGTSTPPEKTRVEEQKDKTPKISVLSTAPTEEEERYASECRCRDAMKLPALWSYIISALSEPSFNVVKIHEGY